MHPHPRARRLKMSQPVVEHAAQDAIGAPRTHQAAQAAQTAQAAVRQIARQTVAHPAARPRSLINRIMWLVILWCAGFGATFIVVLPFHLLVQWASHH
jgi:hypothetical protein